MATADDPVIPKPVRAAPQVSSLDAEEDRRTENYMREYFASRPKVSIKTREDEWVQVNGYTFIIKAGERVEVPDDIAELLENAGRI